MSSRSRYSKSLESVTKRIGVNGVTLVQEEMRIGLADDEMASIVMIDVDYKPDETEIADGNSSLAISLDPDSNIDPLSGDVEDLEFIAGVNISGQDAEIVGCIGKTLVMEGGINVGTNLGLTTMTSDAGRVNGKFTVTIWFVRKRASDVELAKILLKRR